MASHSQIVVFSMSAILFIGIPMPEGNSTPQLSLLSNYNESEIACYRQEKVLYTDGNCYNLLKQGPCARDHWLVLSKEAITLPNGETKTYPECKRKRCRRAVEVYWPETNSCRARGREKHAMCPYQGIRVHTDWWGDGVCDCEEGHVRYEADILTSRGTDAEYEGNCYQLYKQGPCEPRHVLMAVLLDDGSYAGRCSPNPCHSSYDHNPGSMYAQLSASDGVCYKLGDKGPCLPDQIFDVDPITNQPNCVYRENGQVALLLFSDTALRCDGNMDSFTDGCRKSLDIKAVNYVRDKKKPPTRRRSQTRIKRLPVP